MLYGTLGIRKRIWFRGRIPTARTFACLRIVSPISGTSARLATGPGGLPLAGRDSHPLDNRQSFMKASHPPIPIDPHCLVAPYPDLDTLPFIEGRNRRFLVRQVKSGSLGEEDSMPP